MKMNGVVFRRVLSVCVVISVCLFTNASAQHVDNVIVQKLASTSNAYEKYWRNEAQVIHESQEYLDRAKFLLRCKGNNFASTTSFTDQNEKRKIEDLAEEIRTALAVLNDDLEAKKFSMRVFHAAVADLSGEERSNLLKLVNQPEFDELKELSYLLDAFRSMNQSKQTEYGGREFSWQLIPFKQFVFNSSQNGRFLKALDSVDPQLLQDFLSIPSNFSLTAREQQSIIGIRHRLFDASVKIVANVLDSMSYESLNLAYELDQHRITSKLISYSLKASQTQLPLPLLQRKHVSEFGFNCPQIVPPKDDDHSEPSKKAYILRCIAISKSSPAPQSSNDAAYPSSLYPLPRSISLLETAINRAKRIVQSQCTQ